MKRNNDSIQFDSQSEVQEILKMIDKFVKQNPDAKNNEILKEFFYTLDRIDLEW